MTTEQTSLADPNVGVHCTHCCWYHGCKYCDPNCPVANGKVKQAYDCEDCSMHGWEGQPPKDFDFGTVQHWVNRWLFEGCTVDLVEEIFNKRDIVSLLFFAGQIGGLQHEGDVYRFAKMYQHIAERKS